MAFLDFLADEASPPEEFSRWYCDREGCDGEPHGEHWVFCEHPIGRHGPECRHARAAQRPPDGSWFVWLFLAGRGCGKSRSAAEWLIDRALHEQAAEWAVIARNAGDVRKNAEDKGAGLVKVAGSRLVKYNRHDQDIYLDNGAVIHLISAEKADKLRGFNLAGAWADELASWTDAEETWDYGLMPTLRVGSHPRVAVTTTPKRHSVLLRRLVKQAEDEVEQGVPLLARSKVVTKGSTWDNSRNLTTNFIDEMKSTYGGTTVGRQELDAELLSDVDGTLVSFSDIEENRRAPSSFEVFWDGDDEPTETDRILSYMQRVVVGVDPAGSYGEHSDETGIVVCAKGNDGHGYVLEDASGKYSPKAWASRVATLYTKWHAGTVVAEVNQGNNLVEEVVRAVMPTIRFKPVRALQGKLLRAEPVTALYEQGRVHHVGTFVKLEDQLVTFTPEMAMKHTRGKSPDRMDAMVHGFTELGLAKWGPTDAFRRMMESAKDRRDAAADRDGAGAQRDVQRFLRRRPTPRSADEGCPHGRGDRCFTCVAAGRP